MLACLSHVKLIELYPKGGAAESSVRYRASSCNVSCVSFPLRKRKAANSSASHSGKQSEMSTGKINAGRTQEFNKSKKSPWFMMGNWMAKYPKPKCTVYCSEEGCEILTMVWILNLSMGKSTKKMSMWALRAFYDPWFDFCSEFFRSVDLIEVIKRCLNALTFDLSYMWVWSLPIYLGLFGQFICNNLYQEVGTQSIETVKLTFFVFFSG